MNQTVEFIVAALEQMPSEWMWLAIIFVLPIILLLLIKGLARLGSRAPAPSPGVGTPQPRTLETPQPAPRDKAPVADMPAGQESAPGTVVETGKKSAEVPVPKPPPEPEPTQPARTVSFFERLKTGLSKTRRFLSSDIDALFAGRKKLDEEFLEDLEELLITADLGVETAMQLIEKISGKRSKISSTDQLKAILKEEIIPIVDRGTGQEDDVTAKPHVIMVVGVNGVGKTTTIGKLAARYTADGKKVLIAAADTFRAAAVEQLSIWAERSGADIVKHRDNADPAAVAFDGIEAAIARDADIVMVDTAGRLHTKVNLMEELKKIKRTIAKKIPEAPHEILLVLDATTGQNALSQAKLFNDTLNVTGLALTKLDGTAKGGIVVGICSSLKIPLKYIGVGEKIDDLQRFDPIQFTNALF